jgi:hypothetical protein
MSNQIGKKHNSLTAIEKFKLFNWLENNKELATIATAAVVAKSAQDALNFEISIANVLYARRVLGLGRQTQKSGGKKDRIRDLAKYVRELYFHLGLLVPTGLEDIRSGQKREENTKTPEL